MTTKAPVFLTREEIKTTLSGWSKLGASASALADFLENGTDAVFSSDKGLSGKLEQVLSTCSSKALQGLCENEGLALIHKGIKAAMRGHEKAAKAAFSGATASKIALASDFYGWAMGGKPAPHALEAAIEGRREAKAEAAKAEAAKAASGLEAKAEAAKAASGLEAAPSGLEAAPSGLEAAFAAIQGASLDQLVALQAALNGRHEELAATKAA